jgi:methionyl aminopeptidase
MNSSKTSEKLIAMREGGQKLARILEDLLARADRGVTLLFLEERAQKLIKDTGGSPSFQTVSGYTRATCLCVNEVVVHGVPSPYVLQEGDLLTIDVGLLYKGFHTDTAWTKIIGEGKAEGIEKEKFLKVGEEALWKAIKEARPGNRVGHISQTIQRIIEKAGYSIVKSLVGHGVGRQLHEEPQVPGFLRGDIAGTALLTPGMTIAVEVIYAQGDGRVIYENDDGWSIATRDQSLSAVFEHTIAITESEPIVLTQIEK